MLDVAIVSIIIVSILKDVGNASFNVVLDRWHDQLSEVDSITRIIVMVRDILDQLYPTTTF